MPDMERSLSKFVRHGTPCKDRGAPASSVHIAAETALLQHMTLSTAPAVTLRADGE
jgi:hypothetical protein